MEFKWFRYKDAASGKIIKEEPLIRFALINGESSKLIYGRLDSGADCTIIPKKYADEVGIDIRKGERKSGTVYGGKIDLYYFENITIAVRSDKFEIPVSFVDVEEDMALLGLEGFFERYKIIIDRCEKTLVLENIGKCD